MAGFSSVSFIVFAAFAIVSVALLAGCQSENEATSSSAEWLSPTGFVPEFKQRDGDPEKGRYALLHEPYVNCGTPARVFNELQSSFSESFEVLEASGRDTSMDGLPYANTLVTGATGIEVVSSNCLSCHGANLFGELVIGLGNEFADFTQNPSALVERMGALVRGADEITEWERFADRVAAIAPYTQMKTVGVNPANSLTAALIARRDAKTNAWLEQAALPLPPTNPPPVSVPPWWRMAKKHAMFNLSEGREDHARTMLAASMLCIDSVDELNAIDEYAPDIRAYLSSIKAPVYPFDIDPILAAAGADVYELNCASCHGTYGESHTYPNLVTPINEVKTDRRLLELATDERGRQYANWFNDSWFGELSATAPAIGYVAPPLDGIWATAPFLHNGSIPSLRQLLQPDSRPAVWRHLATDAVDPEQFDMANVGWQHEVLRADAASGANSDPDKQTYDTNRVYDTRWDGYGNGGHTYGASLNEDAVLALLEYLKTL